MQLNAKIALSLLLATSSASAHLNQDYVVRGHRNLLRRGPPQNAAEAAKLHGGFDQECQTLKDEEITKMKDSYPQVSEIASIPQNDEEAKQVWQDIKNSGIIPKNVKAKPQKGSNNMGVNSENYNSQDDSDCWWTASKCTEPKAESLMKDIATCDETGTWGLTFDDGPNCTHNEFYDFLKKEKLKATMFYIGSNVFNWAYQAQRGLADGHDICVHTWSHRYTTTLEDEQVFAELYYTAKVIKQVVGVTPTCWRPPFGDVDDRVRAIAQGLGLRTILWQEDTDDWEIKNEQQPNGKSPEQIKQNYEKICEKSDSESPIVLTHEINGDTMKAFQDNYPKVKDSYKNVVPLTACQNVEKPYPDSDITYPGFNDFADGKIEPKGLPSIDSMKIDSSRKFEPQELSKQKDGYANPDESKGSSGNDKSDDDKSSDDNSSEDKSGDDKSGDGNNAAALSVSKSFIALAGATMSLITFL